MGEKANAFPGASLANFRQYLVFSLVCSLAVGISALTSAASPALAREQWQMQHPPGPAPSGPITNSFLNEAASQVPGTPGYQGGPAGGGQPASFAPGLVAPVNGGGPPVGSENVPGLVGIPQNPYTKRPMMGTPDFVKQMLANRISEGTVLTGVLADDLSSKKSLPGDIFSIVLPDGYAINGIDVVPRNARIVGAVVSVTPAHKQRGVGTPGNLEVGLTTLVFPDGRSIKFRGHIDRNPAHDMKPPKVQNHGFALSNYASSLSSMVGSFTSGIGGVRKLNDRGLDFFLAGGEAVPIRVTSALDLTQMTPPTVGSPINASSPTNNQANNQQNNQGNIQAGNAQTANPALPGGTAPITYPGGPITLPRELPDPF